MKKKDETLLARSPSQTHSKSSCSMERLRHCEARCCQEEEEEGACWRRGGEEVGSIVFDDDLSRVGIDEVSLEGRWTSDASKGKKITNPFELSRTLFPPSQPPLTSLPPSFLLRCMRDASPGSAPSSTSCRRCCPAVDDDDADERDFFFVFADDGCSHHHHHHRPLASPSAPANGSPHHGPRSLSYARSLSAAFNRGKS